MVLVIGLFAGFGWISFLGEESSGSEWVSLTDILLALGLVLALIFACFFAIRKVMKWSGATPGSSGKHLSIIESMTLAPRTSIHLAVIHDRVLILSQTEGGIQLVSEIKDPDFVAGLAKSQEAELTFAGHLLRQTEQVQQRAVGS